MMNEIFEQVKALILTVEPNAAFFEKYGGIIVESAPGHAKSQFCGVFAYTNHVSLEFTHGAELDDPDGILEGRGKHRRHIKIARLSDITQKRCEDFLRQARGLQGDFL
ncbi:DUF1801 domain-containing protein [Ponticoccus litoralis]|uniref:DUF1801 domain-containing protein n=1 Tax=Ponticoccus litoralis TaxID=422297 RepID=A0AAW9SUX8_9RHOB